jgi:hypothetical protein
MFDTLSIKELKLLLRELREHHSIKGVTKMKRAELVAALQERFVLRDDGNLYLKEDTRPAKTPSAAPAPRAKKAPKTAAALMAEYSGIEHSDHAAIKRELTADLKGFTGDPLTKFYPILMKFGYEV